MELRPSRRTLLIGTALSGAGTLFGSGCGATAVGETPRRNGRVLLAYFSRAGENFYNGGRRDLEVGNTGVLARMIADLTEVDLHEIEAADPYPDSYDATVARNVTEQNDDARPAIANPLATVDGYATVLLASPVWNVRAPMIMSTFTDAYDFAGKTVLPVVTYAVSGLGSVARDYAAACPGARVGTGLAVRGEDVARQSSQVRRWLDDCGLTLR